MRRSAKSRICGVSWLIYKSVGRILRDAWRGITPRPLFESDCQKAILSAILQPAEKAAQLGEKRLDLVALDVDVIELDRFLHHVLRQIEAERANIGRAFASTPRPLPLIRVPAKPPQSVKEP